MNRRKFLGLLGAAAVATQVAPLLKLTKSAGYSTYLCGKDALISDVEYYKARRKEVGPGGWVSYRVHFTTTLPPTCWKRIRLT